MKKNDSIAPDFIKFAAVVAAMPRWVLALLAADGFTVPLSWTWVHALSAVFGACMTILEGIAIAYILGAIANADSKHIRKLTLLVIATFITFVGVLAPSIYSRVTGISVGTILVSWALWGWSICVASSTIFTVAAVGYAQAVNTKRFEWEQTMLQWQYNAEELKKELDNERIRNDRLIKDIAEQDEQIRKLAESKSPDMDKQNKIDKNDLMARFLDVIKEQGGTPLLQKEIAAKLNVSSPTMSRLVTRAKAEGRISGNGRLEIVRVADEQ